MSSQINIGQISEALNEKADTDLKNTPINVDSAGLMYKDGAAIYSPSNVEVRLQAGSTVNDGGLIAVYGPNSTTSVPGGFRLRAATTDGTFKDLLGYTDGNLTWAGQQIMLGAQLNTLGTPCFARRNTDDSYLEFWGATTWEKGAYVRADGMGGPNAGSFTIAACDGTTTKHLRGLPDGSFTWAGQHIVRLTAYSHTTTAWYRKYSDGWVEQGGIHNRGTTNVVTLVVAMANADYCVNISCVSGSHRYAFAGSRTTTSFNFSAADDSSQNNDGTYAWYVCGKHA